MRYCAKCESPRQPKLIQSLPRRKPQNWRFLGLSRIDYYNSIRSKERESIGNMISNRSWQSDLSSAHEVISDMIGGMSCQKVVIVW